MIQKYLRLSWAFFKASLMADLEYRANLLTKIGTDLLWYVTQMSLFEVLFLHMPLISGWTIAEVRVFLGILFLVDGFWALLFWENLDGLSMRVKTGELDLLLAKPVSSQFMVSFRKMSPAYLVNIALVFAYIFWSLSQTERGIHWEDPFVVLAVVPFGVMIAYSIRFAFASLAVIFVNAESLNFVWYNIYRMGTRPDGIYPRWLRFLVMSFLPVAFIASVPARLVLDKAQPWMWIATPLMGLVPVVATVYMWKWVLKRYQSASS